MGDMDRQQAVEQASRGCVVAVLVLAMITTGVAAPAFSSVATPILASLLILGGLGLAVMEWAERG
jgi:hypothetical protein